MEFVNIDYSFDSALAEIHSDTSGIKWVCYHYVDKANTLSLLASGTENEIEAVLKHFTEDTAVYAVIRRDHMIDKSTTVKFVFLSWVSIRSPVRKSFLSTHRSQIEKLLSPLHATLTYNDPEDLVSVNDDIERAIGKASGTQNNLTDRSAFALEQKVSGPTAVKKNVDYKKGGFKPFQGVNQSTGSVLNVDESVTDTIKAIRDDVNPTKWMLAKYADKKTLTLACCGDGNEDSPANDLKKNLGDDETLYGLWIENPPFDEVTKTTVKFCFLKWVPPAVKPGFKAILTTHKAIVSEIFSPFHRDFFADCLDDISEDVIMGKLKEMMVSEHV